MCQFATLITDVVNDFVNENKMFTAHNVTAEVRRRVRDRVNHDDVKRDVHRMFNDGEMFSYNRSLASLSGVSPQPWVYHPISADVSLYNGQPTVDGQPVTASPLAASLNCSATVVSNTPDGVYKLDTTNRLCIPAKLVRQAGLSAGNAMQLYESGPDELVLTSVSQAAKMQAAHLITTYVVDSYDNVRITQAALQKGRLNGTEFKLDGDNEKIVVRKS